MRSLVLGLVAVITASGAVGFGGIAGPASGVIKFVFWQCLVLLALGLVAHISATWDEEPPPEADRQPPSAGPVSRR